VVTYRYLIDTNVLSERQRPRPHPGVLERLDAVENDAAMPAIVWHELRYGLARLPTGRRRDVLALHIDDVRARFEVLPYDEPAARWHADERARLEAQGVSRPFADGQIAATAAVRGMVLVTRNTTDFEAYRGLAVESWWT
jgi:tRNA(fMet)-specific endonuclease VapC